MVAKKERTIEYNGCEIINSVIIHLIIDGVATPVRLDDADLRDLYYELSNADVY